MGWLEILTNMHTYDKIINSHAIVGVSQMIKNDKCKTLIVIQR